jgi:fumarylacetoacetase
MRVEIDQKSDFGINNLPFGIAEMRGQCFAASRLGDYVIHLKAAHDHGVFDGLSLDAKLLSEPSLNKFIGLGKATTNGVRRRLMDLFSGELNETLFSDICIPWNDVRMKMPISVGDYTDFYSSKEHATNVGIMFRDPANALLPNWLHLPVGYHGRASSIVVSGTEIKRPKGQMLPNDSDTPVYGPCRLLDFELEMGFVIGKENPMGVPISIEEAEDYIFGLILFNDWSARDIQKWEYVPLGPFLGKNFASTVSPWIIALEALDAFRVEGPTQEPAPLTYLQYSGKKNYDIEMEVIIRPENGMENVVCRSNFKYMYWNMCQQLAHHTVNGCNMKIGDICASGTISGPTEDSYGSMLELSWKGTRPVKLKDGLERKFIQDGDTVTLRAWAGGKGSGIGFGDCSGKIVL